MKIKSTFSTYFLCIAIILLAFSACSTGTHLTKCPDFKGQQEQVRVSKKKVKKQRKAEHKAQDRRSRIRKVENSPKEEVLALLDKNELLEIPNAINHAIAIPETAKIISIEWSEDISLIDQFKVLDQKDLTTREVQQVGKELFEDFNNLSKVEQKAKKKEMRKAMKSTVKKAKYRGSDTDLLLIIIAVLIPPLGMFLYEDGASSRFWLSLLLTLVGYFPGLIYTLYIILTER